MSSPSDQRPLAGAAGGQRRQAPNGGEAVELPRPAGETADQTTVRRANLGVVLGQVASRGRSSRAAIAAETGLTRSTVSSLVSELMDLGLVRETERTVRPRRVGRPGVDLELSDRAVGVGLEINVEHLAVCVEDMTGRVRHDKVVHVDNRRSAPERVVERLCKLAETALAEVEEEGLVPVGIGLAVPGLVAVDKGELLIAPNLRWSQIALAEMLVERLPGLPVRVDNESNFAAMAEHWRGSARNLRSFLFVFGEVGVGGGIFVDGEPYRGEHGFGGEVGHMTIAPGGELCACGSRGCLETVAGQDAIARRAGIPLETAGRVQNMTRELVKRARRGDEATLASLHEAGLALGAAVASAINLLDLEAVILGGCFAPLAPWLVEDVRAALQSSVLAGGLTPSAVATSELGLDAAVRGAAVLPLRELLAAPWMLHDLGNGSTSSATFARRG